MDPSPSGLEPPHKSIPKLAQVGWRAMLIFNLGLGAYMFAKKHEKDIDAGKKKGVKKSNKGWKKVKEDAENTNNANKETESAIPEKEETKPIIEPEPEPDSLLELTDSADDQLVFQTLTDESVKVARKP